MSALAAALPASGSSSASTIISVYRPFTPRGSTHLSVLVRAGTCPSGSEVSPRRDAWRCFSGNEILDPCFSSPKRRNVVLCPLAPWFDRGTELRLHKPLVAAQGNHARPSTGLTPWALQLADGRRCIYAEGATSVVAGERLNYFCGTFTEGLWGAPDRTSEPWTILIGSSKATSLEERVAIARAWA